MPSPCFFHPSILCISCGRVLKNWLTRVSSLPLSSASSLPPGHTVHVVALPSLSLCVIATKQPRRENIPFIYLYIFFLWFSALRLPSIFRSHRRLFFFSQAAAVTDLDNSSLKQHDLQLRLLICSAAFRYAAQNR